MTRLVMLAAFLVACSSKGDSGPPCDKVVDHMLELTKQMMPGHDMDSLGNRKQMIDQCVQRKMPASVRKCLLDAKVFADLASCRAKDAKPPTPARPAPQPPTPSAPAPAPADPAPAPSAPAPAPAEPGSGG